MSERRSHRMTREQDTLEAMLRIYCHGHHGKALCPECEALSDYARERLARCPYQELKPTCERCPVHCYRPAERERIRAVMRYAGPRMIYRHPLMAFRHLAAQRRAPPEKARDR